MNEQTIEIYKYTHLHGGWVEYSADDDKYSDERRVDVVRKECITVTDLEFLHLPRWCALLATSQPPGEKPSNAAELFREALACAPHSKPVDDELVRVVAAVQKLQELKNEE